MIAEASAQQPAKDIVRVATHTDCELRMTLLQLRFIAIHLDDLTGGNELLPVEAALLHGQPCAQRDQQVCLLQQHVAVPHAPGVRAAEVCRMARIQTIRGIPRQHDRDTGLPKQRSKLCCRIAIDARAEQKDGALRPLDAFGKTLDFRIGDRWELCLERRNGGVECLRIHLRTLNI